MFKNVSERDTMPTRVPPRVPPDYLLLAADWNFCAPGEIGAATVARFVEQICAEPLRSG